MLGRNWPYLAVVKHVNNELNLIELLLLLSSLLLSRVTNNKYQHLRVFSGENSFFASLIFLFVLSKEIITAKQSRNQRGLFLSTVALLVIP
jgi:hypothetical protein